MLQFGLIMALAASPETSKEEAVAALSVLMAASPETVKEEAAAALAASKAANPEVAAAQLVHCCTSFSCGWCYLRKPPPTATT
jgi:hypothetical protein